MMQSCWSPTRSAMGNTSKPRASTSRGVIVLIWHPVSSRAQTLSPSTVIREMFSIPHHRVYGSGTIPDSPGPAPGTELEHWTTGRRKGFPRLLLFPRFTSERRKDSQCLRYCGCWRAALAATMSSSLWGGGFPSVPLPLGGLKLPVPSRTKRSL